MEKISSALDFILLNIGFLDLNANWNWRDIYSPFARIYYVKEGEAKTRINDRVYHLKPKRLYLTPPFTLHDDECDSHFSLYYIHFFENVFDKESIFDIYDFPVEISASLLDLLSVERLMEINPGRHLQNIDPKQYDNPPAFSRYLAANKRMPLHTILESQGILYQLMAKFIEHAAFKSESKDHRVSKCLRFIHENTNKDISISQLANIACLTEDHFIRIFKKEVNTTPLKYINLKKTERARLLLLTTDIPIRDIAFELSMDNISYFNRIFKQYTGKTPSAYRNEYNKIYT